MDALFKLKLLNGPLAGRELELPQGEIRLGGIDPDMVLPLEEGAETVLTLTPEGISIAPALPVWVEGEAWDTVQPLPLHRVIDLAGQALVFGKIGDNLTTCPIPPRKELKHKPLRMGLAIRSISLITALLSLIGVALAFSKPTRPLPVGAETWFSQQMRVPWWGALGVELDKHGVVQLSGVADSSQVIQRLEKELIEHGFLFQNNSIGADTLRKMVQDVMEMYGYQAIQVIAETPDSVIIYGDIHSDKNWIKANEKLAEIQGLKKWKVINDRAELFSRLLRQLHSQSLLDGLSITTTTSELLINGQLSRENEERLNVAINSFNNENNPRLKARYQNIPSATTANSILPAAIVSVGGNAEKIYLQLANNMRLYEGATLPNDYKVYSLTRRELTLVRGQTLIFIDLNL